MLNKRATYGDDWGVPSAEHPAGPCLNRSAPGVEDGSYFEKAWVNDLMALPGAIMNAAGYTPNGKEDTATASQVFDALVNNRWTPIANYSAGTIITGSDGKQYKSVQDNGRDFTTIDPVSATNRLFWVEFPFERVEDPSGYALIWHDGYIEQYITVSMPSLTSSPQSGSFIVPFTNLNSVKVYSTGNRISSSTELGFVITESEKVSVNSFKFKMLNFSANGGIKPISWNTQIYIKATGN